MRNFFTPGLVPTLGWTPPLVCYNNQIKTSKLKHIGLARLGTDNGAADSPIVLGSSNLVKKMLRTGLIMDGRSAERLNGRLAVRPNVRTMAGR